MRIFPATTISLPNFFTPRRLLTLSRPFLTLPCPFLCAMKLSGFVRGFGLCLLRLRRLSAKADAGNFNPGQFPAMTDCPVITLPAAIFKRDDFLVLALLEHLTGDRRPLDQGGPVGDFVSVAVKKDVGENTLFAGLLIEEIH